MHPNPPVQLPYEFYVPTDFRRSCINFAIGAYKGYQYHNEVYELAKKYLNYARYKKKRINKVLKPLIKENNKRWHVVKRLSKYHKTGTLDPPKFPVVNPHRIDFYGSRYEDLKKAKSGYFIKVQLFDGTKWDWFRIPVIVEGYHKKTLEEVSKVLSPSIRVRNNKLFVYFPVEKEICDNANTPEEHVVSIDLGLRNLATITVHEKETRKLKKVYFISGRIITAFWRKVDYILSSIKSISRNHNKKIVSKWYDSLSKTNNWIAQYVSKKIVDIAEEFKNSVIVFEDLKFDSRNRLSSKKINRRLHLWMHGSIKELTEYKAMWRGIKIGKRVDPAHSEASEQYHYLDGTKGERFSPSPKKSGNRECVEIINSDFNAAQNIFKRYIGIEPNEPIYKIGSKGEVVSPEEHVLFKEKAYQTSLHSFV